MTIEKRVFRSQESIEAAEFTRSSVIPYLSSRGFRKLDDQRRQHEQLVTAIDPAGRQIKMRVRTCWSWSKQPEGKRKMSACQLTAGNRGGWEATFQRLALAQERAGVTHFLIVQGDELEIQIAALVPVSAMYAIWQKQREVCAAQIQAGNMGKVKANAAENGDSPTIWLKDERASGGRVVAAVLWEWPDVQNLSELKPRTEVTDAPDDTFDDLAYIDYSQFGSDGSSRVIRYRSEVKRDDRVRQTVLQRAINYGCERNSCGENRPFKGFLDVHHILGVEKSDRVWNCVALCPNCHREAHFSPDREKINRELLDYAARYMISSTGVDRGTQEAAAI